MCGIMALLLAQQHQPAAPELNEGLSLLQHRGQDAAGIVTCGFRGRFFQCKGNGLVRDVFDAAALSRLSGSMGIGHVRYPTAGSSNHAEAQPFYVNSPYGITFAHNGNLVNTAELQQFLDADAHRHINTGSDSELLLNLLADNLQETGKVRINEEDIFDAIGGLMREANGGYACTVMLAGFGIVAFRDPNGIRPVGICTRRAFAEDEGTPLTDLPHTSKDFCFASESVVGDALGFEQYEDLKPGEAIIITQSQVSRQILKPSPTPFNPYAFTPDIFEWVYFARPDSVLDGVSVYRARMAMGDKLAETVRRTLAQSSETVDVVIPVPDTSRVAALQLAQQLRLAYREGFIKNRYVGRTFIMPGRDVRRKNVRKKLNAMALEFAGKNVLIVDDSIVRGTTSLEIIQMARDAGAKKVIMASCAPPIRYPNVYGIDMPSRRELVAYGRTEMEVGAHIQADLVIYQSLEDLVDAIKPLNPDLKQFDCSVFDGKYTTGVEPSYLEHLESLRSENLKQKKQQSALHPVPSSPTPSPTVRSSPANADGNRTSTSDKILPSPSPVVSRTTCRHEEDLSLYNGVVH